MAEKYKQHPKHWERSYPTQRQLAPQFSRLSIDPARRSSNQKQNVPHSNRSFIGRSSKPVVQSTRSIAYPDGAVFRWFATNLDGDNQLPSSVCLERISLGPIKKTGEKSLVLVNSHPAKDKVEKQGDMSRRPWESVAENVWPDLLSCFEIVRKKMKCQELEEVQPKLVARFGKVIFHENVSRCLDNARKGQLSETNLGKFSKSFYTNVPTSYSERIIGEVVPNIEVDFEEEKDIYHVRLSDSKQLDSIISCKCSLNEDKKLELYKVKLIHQLRQMVINISCLDKDLDLRLMLSSKRILTALTDDEMQRINNLINSAVLDPDAGGGLRWPQEAYSRSSRYNIVGVWHTISKVYKSPSLMLQVRHADRYNFETGTGEVTTEVTLKLKGLVSELLAQKLERVSIYNMFKGTLGMIWEHFLCCERFLT